MLIDVIEVKDNPDGTATITFNVDEEAAQFLISYAVKDILIKQFERETQDLQNDQNEV